MEEAVFGSTTKDERDFKILSEKCTLSPQSCWNCKLEMGGSQSSNRWAGVGGTRLCGPCLSAREGRPRVCSEFWNRRTCSVLARTSSTGMMTLLSFQVTPEGGTGWCSWSCSITGTHSDLLPEEPPRPFFYASFPCSFPLSTQSHFQFLSIPGSSYLCFYLCI